MVSLQTSENPRFPWSALIDRPHRVSIFLSLRLPRLRRQEFPQPVCPRALHLIPLALQAFPKDRFPGRFPATDLSDLHGPAAAVAAFRGPEPAVPERLRR